LFSPDRIYTDKTDLRRCTAWAGAPIRWYAESCGGETVFCEEMGLEEFCEQYQRNNCLIIRKSLHAPSASAWFIRRKLTLIAGGKSPTRNSAGRDPQPPDRR